MARLVWDDASSPRPRGTDQDTATTSSSTSEAHENNQPGKDVADRDNLDYEPELARPLSENRRRRLTQRTKKLLKRRVDLDLEVFRTVQTGIGDYKALLRKGMKLAKREKRHLGKCVGELKELKSIYMKDPSEDRDRDVSFVRNIIRELIWRDPGPLPALGKRSNQEAKREEQGLTNGDLLPQSASPHAPNTASEGQENQGPKVLPATENDNMNGVGKCESPVPIAATAAQYDARVSTSPTVSNGGAEQQRIHTTPKRVQFAVPVIMEVSPVSQDPPVGEDLGLESAATNSSERCNGLRREEDAESQDEKKAYATPEKYGAKDKQAYLEKIVTSGFDTVDACIRDIPNSSFSFKHEGQGHSSDLDTMSGALGKPEFSGLQSTVIYSPSHPSTFFSPSLDAFVKRLNTISKAKQSDIPDGFARRSNLNIASFSNHMDNNGAGLKQSHLLSPAEITRSQYRRETPVPAPEPWKSLGISLQNALGIEDPQAMVESSNTSNDDGTVCEPESPNTNYGNGTVSEHESPNTNNGNGIVVGSEPESSPLVRLSKRKKKKDKKGKKGTAAVPVLAKL
ncbi:hypothetical protein GGS20DRAFT_599316 [Poronia punctata]|nr:hypothetical protein GGS20DRAFT_599316 [Poronia punctata]